MKFIVSRNELFERLQSIGKVINPKSTTPILDNFLFEIQGEEVTLTASDKTSTLISTLVIQESSESGRITIPSKILLEILKELPEQPLTFELDVQDLVIKLLSNNGEYSIIGQDANEYPSIAPLNEENSRSFTVPSDTLQIGINKTIFATAEDEYRPVMNGIFLEVKQNELTFVASDAHKLVRYKKSDIQSDIDASFILPKKPAELIKNLILKGGEESQSKVEIHFDDKHAHISLPGYKLICLLIEGKYPNYKSVIPENNPYKLIIDRLSFASTLKRVSIFSNQSSNLVKLELDKSKITISAQDIDFSISAVETLNCQYTGEPMQIGFKSTFLRDILQNIPHQEIILELADSTKAGIFLPLAEQENKEKNAADILMLLMPMMITSSNAVEG